MFLSKNEIKSGFNRSGFTLPELLIVIAIISVLATLSVGVMRQAQVEARVSATRARISQIEALMQLRMEDYEVRRLPISIGELRNFVIANPLNPMPTEAVGDFVRVRNLRRRILAEIISAEIAQPPVAFSNPAGGAVGDFPSSRVPFDAHPDYSDGFLNWLNDVYPNPFGGQTLAQRLNQLSPSEVIRWRGFDAALDTNGNPFFDNPGEYLYEILRRTDVEGQSGLEVLGNSAVGDFDADGIPEVVDAFGIPLQLRVLQVDAAEDDIVGSELWIDSPTNWTNPDPTTLVPEGYRLVNPTIARELQQIRFQVVSVSPEMGI